MTNTHRVMTTIAGLSIGLGLGLCSMSVLAVGLLLAVVTFPGVWERM